MRVFRDLEITVPQSEIDAFILGIESRLANGWERDKEAEARSPGPGEYRFFYFVCNETDQREPALLALVQRSEDTFYVANIVPQKDSELTYNQYNAILAEFYEKFVAPTVKDFGLSVKITDDQQTIRDWISLESAEKLERFSKLANKSTGSSHPLDQERWFDFLVSVVENDDDFYPDRLERWLIEGDGWPPDMAQELAIKYEQGLALLRYYRSH